MRPSRLLDAVSDDGEAASAVRGKRRAASATSRSAFRIARAAPQTHRAGPAAITGLGFDFWSRRFRAVSGGRAGRAAAKAGLAAGDEIIAMDGTPVRRLRASVGDYVRARPGQDIELIACRRGDERPDACASPRGSEVDGGKTIGRLRIEAAGSQRP